MRTRRPPLAVSREGRDTLWLVGVLALSIYPHAGHMPWWCIGGVSFALLWRAYLAVRDAALPPRWVLLVALAASVALTFMTFRSIFGREAGVTLVSVLAGLKTLELRARRDAFVVTSLGFFLILTQFLYSQSIGTAVLMGAVFWGLLTSLVLAQRPLYRPTIWSAMRASGRTVLMGLPAMLVLYVLFPRIGPLWSLPADAQTSIGLSDQLSLGHVAELAQDDGIAMRLRFDGPPPAPDKLYFRGPVLELFDGRAWLPRHVSPSSQQPNRQELEAVQPQGLPIRYQVTLEPTHLTTLPLLEGTLQLRPLNPATSATPQRQGLHWSVPSALNDRTQWEGQAWPNYQAGPTAPTASLRDLLQLPGGLNPRTLQWAHELQARTEGGQASPEVLVAAVMKHIATQAYTYTLTPGDTGLTPQGEPERHLIDQFWMDRRTGFCEHFATAFVVVMRAMGVPARVVTGYQGMELNAVDGLFVVRNNHAHAWAEFWQPGRGWVRADPTAAVSPDRIQRSRPLTKPRDGLAGALPQLDSPLWKHTKALFEATNHRWNVWVLEYSRGKQLALLQQWGWDSPDWVELIRLCASLMAGLSGLGIVWLWWNRPRSKQSPWQRQLRRVHRSLVAAGMSAPPQSAQPAPAMSWHQALSSIRPGPAEAETIAQIMSRLAELDALRYAPQTQAARELQRRSGQLVAQIEQLSKQWRQLRARPQVRAHSNAD
ncbi:MAG: transglutaminaseTgpA domain-containing protein [Acidobacteriota bacterium]